MNGASLVNAAKFVKKELRKEQEHVLATDVKEMRKIHESVLNITVQAKQFFQRVVINVTSFFTT